MASASRPAQPPWIHSTRLGSLRETATVLPATVDYSLDYVYPPKKKARWNVHALYDEQLNNLAPGAKHSPLNGNPQFWPKTGKNSTKHLSGRAGPPVS